MLSGNKMEKWKFFNLNLQLGTAKFLPKFLHDACRYTGNCIEPSYIHPILSPPPPPPPPNR
jgi:hypothetical protein